MTSPSRALACLELSSIARGVRVVDAVCKRAPVRVFHQARHSPGKYVILFDGDVADVEESYDDGLQWCGDALLDYLLLSVAHDDIWRGLASDFAAVDGSAALMVETTNIATSIASLDFVLKLVETRLVDWQLGNGIGGKGYFAVQGEQHDVEHARDELLMRLDPMALAGIDVIANPHEEMLAAFGHAGPFDR